MGRQVFFVSVSHISAKGARAKQHWRTHHCLTCWLPCSHSSLPPHCRGHGRAKKPFASFLH